jgi:type IV pilus assembly protein PilV
MDGAEMRRDKSEKGFSLIEVMIALVVLLVGMLGIMGMQYYAVSGNAASRELRMATNLGQDMIESLKSTPYGNLSSNSDTPVSGVAISGGVDFDRRWWVVSNCIAITLAGDDNSCTAMAASCTSAPGGVTVPVSAVRARACWTDKTGGIHSVTMDTVRWDKDAFF